MWYVIPQSRDKKIEIRSRLDNMKNTITTVVVPSTTLFDLSFDEFVEMVTDYSQKRVGQVCDKG